jgi:hypothetical protein
MDTLRSAVALFLVYAVLTAYGVFGVAALAYLVFVH